MSAENSRKVGRWGIYAAPLGRLNARLLAATARLLPGVDDAFPVDPGVWYTQMMDRATATVLLRSIEWALAAPDFPVALRRSSTNLRDDLDEWLRSADPGADAWRSTFAR